MIHINVLFFPSAFMHIISDISDNLQSSFISTQKMEERKRFVSLAYGATLINDAF